MHLQQQDVVAKAKSYVRTLYQDEPIAEIGLEEIEYDATDRVWLVTLGVARKSSQNDLIAQLGGMLRRSFKVVQIADDDGRPLSMKDRETHA